MKQPVSATPSSPNANLAKNTIKPFDLLKMYDKGVLWGYIGQKRLGITVLLLLIHSLTACTPFSSSLRDFCRCVGHEPLVRRQQIISWLCHAHFTHMHTHRGTAINQDLFIDRSTFISVLICLLIRNMIRYVDM